MPLDTMLAVLAVVLAVTITTSCSFLLDGLDRRVHARMQGRLGPPLTQSYRDFVKLLGKQTMVPSGAARAVFLTAPHVSVACATAGATIPVLAQFFSLSFFGDAILVMYLLAVPTIMKILGGAASGSPYAAIGFSREISMLIAYEVPLVCAVFIVSFATGGSISCVDFINVQQATGTPLAIQSPSALLSSILFLACLGPAIGMVPYDVAEAKTEVAHGPLVEYSGRELALMKLSRWIKAFGLYYLGALVFFNVPARGWFGNTTIDSVVSGSLLLLVAPAIMLVSVTIPRTVSARMKVGQAFRRFWLVNVLFLVLATVLVSVKM